jgi:hypothetical protein
MFLKMSFYRPAVNEEKRKYVNWGFMLILEAEQNNNKAIECWDILVAILELQKYK